MNNIKDYMMWLDDKGIADWDDVLGELIIPEGTIIYTDELINDYQNDSEWHGNTTPKTTESTNSDINGAIKSRSFTVSNAINNIDEIDSYFDMVDVIDDDPSNSIRVAKETIDLIAALTLQFNVCHFDEDEKELITETASRACELIETNSKKDETNDY